MPRNRDEGRPAPVRGESLSGLLREQAAVLQQGDVRKTVASGGRYRAALSGSGRLWAVALPVAIRYTGDPQPGLPLA